MARWIVAAGLVVAVSGAAAAQEPVVPVKKDRVMDGVGRGAAAGAVVALPMAIAQIAACDTGCDWSSTPMILVAWSVLGAAAGSAIGLAADVDSPAPLSARVGGVYRTTSMRGGVLSGSAMTPGFALSVRLSRHISVHSEYVKVGMRFASVPGSVPQNVLDNLVTQVPDSRPAGFERGLESRRVDFIFTELVGFHPAPIGRVRLEFLGGIGVQGEEQRAYYDAYRTLMHGGASGVEPVEGKYYVLGFESPETGWVFGMDADVTLARGLSIVPTVRYHALERSSASLSYGAGIHWRF